MMTKVMKAWRSSGSVLRSAASKARKTRRRISSASSMLFSPGAAAAQSSCPKYEWVAPVASSRKS